MPRKPNPVLRSVVVRVTQSEEYALGKITKSNGFRDEFLNDEDVYLSLVNLYGKVRKAWVRKRG